MNRKRGAKESSYSGVYRSTPKCGMKSLIDYYEQRPWVASLTVNGLRWRGKARESEREAALDYDRRVLELGLDKPLNILKRKP